MKRELNTEEQEFIKKSLQEKLGEETIIKLKIVNNISFNNRGKYNLLVQKIPVRLI